MDCKYRLFKGVRVPITKEIISHFVREQHKRYATPAGHKRHPHIFGTIEFSFVEFYRKKSVIVKDIFVEAIFGGYRNKAVVLSWVQCISKKM
jgi:hypothetical protein